MDFIVSLDYQISTFVVNNMRNDILTPIMQFFNIIGSFGVIWIVIAFILMFFKSTRRSAMTILLVLVCVTLITELGLKNIFMRIPPFEKYPDEITELMTPITTNFSFPSLHAASAFAVTVVLFLTKKYLGIIGLIIAITISLSRIYMGLDFASDIIAGLIIGVLIAIVLFRLNEKFMTYLHYLRLHKKLK